QRVAKVLGCQYRKLTYGEWMVLGGKGSRPTIFQVIDTLHAGKTIVHLDELDKVQPGGGSDWAAAISSDLYNLLDKRLNINEFLINTSYGQQTPPSVEELQNRVETDLWLVGSGTWQGLHEVVFFGKTL